MNDVLSITDLELWTHIGVPDEERALEQRLLISIALTLDTKAAAKADDVHKSTNYNDVTMDMHVLAKKERKTIERFAEDAAVMILKKYKPASVTITVKKFAVPGTKEVSITIIRPTTTERVTS
jgi:FolB domain-containing protein